MIVTCITLDASSPVGLVLLSFRLRREEEVEEEAAGEEREEEAKGANSEEEEEKETTGSIDGDSLNLRLRSTREEGVAAGGVDMTND